ncbi:hypothetical protein VTN96DRAFT_3383 [Rasamsonia emersonii]
MGDLVLEGPSTYNGHYETTPVAANGRIALRVPDVAGGAKSTSWPSTDKRPVRPRGIADTAPDPGRLAQAHTTCVQRATQANTLRLGPEPNPHGDPSLQQ